jgi:hypothetical protein
MPNQIINFDGNLKDNAFEKILILVDISLNLPRVSETIYKKWLFDMCLINKRIKYRKICYDFLLHKKSDNLNDSNKLINNIIPNIAYLVVMYL